jgi:hypothetical protein
MARFTGQLVNNTGLDIRGIFEDAIRDADGGDLPEEIADLFTVTRITYSDGEAALLVNMMDD